MYLSGMLQNTADSALFSPVNQTVFAKGPIFANDQFDAIKSNNKTMKNSQGWWCFPKKVCSVWIGAICFLTKCLKKMVAIFHGMKITIFDKH
jgi:hypothetical protein